MVQQPPAPDEVQQKVPHGVQLRVRVLREKVEVFVRGQPTGAEARERRGPTVDQGHSSQKAEASWTQKSSHVSVQQGGAKKQSSSCGSKGESS